MDVEQKLRNAIKDALQQVKKASFPKVYDAIQTAGGYKNVENRIIIMVTNEGITPEGAIPYIEQAL
jgi:hypothetical protein